MRDLALERTFETLLRSTTVAIVATDRRVRVQMWNPGAERMFGWSAEEVIGQPLPILVPERREEMERLRDRVLAGEEFDRLEIEHRTKSGDRVRNLVSLRPLRGPSGDVRGVIGVASESAPDEGIEGVADRLRDLELELVDSRLPPHFLFNSLHPVGSCLRTGEAELALRTLDQLGRLLRYVVDADRSGRVPLGREIGFIRDYVHLAATRGRRDLELCVRADADALRVPVPALLLQPAVENAVKHGIDRRPGAGRIEIRARREECDAEIEILDDGPGLPDGWCLSEAAGVGLRAVDARLRRHYGAEGAIAVESRRDGPGTRVRITVPAADEDGAD